VQIGAFGATWPLTPAFAKDRFPHPLEKSSHWQEMTASRSVKASGPRRGGHSVEIATSRIRWHPNGITATAFTGCQTAVRCSVPRNCVAYGASSVSPRRYEEEGTAMEEPRFSRRGLNERPDTRVRASRLIMYIRQPAGSLRRTGPAPHRCAHASGTGNDQGGRVGAEKCGPMGRFGPVRRVPLIDVVYEDRWGVRPICSDPGTKTCLPQLPVRDNIVFDKEFRQSST